MLIKRKYVSIYINKLSASWNTIGQQCTNFPSKSRRGLRVTSKQHKNLPLISITCSNLFLWMLLSIWIRKSYRTFAQIWKLNKYLWVCRVASTTAFWCTSINFSNMSVYKSSNQAWSFLAVLFMSPANSPYTD